MDRDTLLAVSDRLAREWDKKGAKAEFVDAAACVDIMLDEVEQDRSRLAAKAETCSQEMPERKYSSPPALGAPYDMIVLAGDRKRGVSVDLATFCRESLAEPMDGLVFACATLSELNSDPYTCTKCQAPMTYSWSRIIWDTSKHGYITRTYVECQHCGEKNKDLRLPDMVKCFRTANHEAQKGDLAMVRRFVETVLGEAWDDGPLSPEDSKLAGELIRSGGKYEPEPDTVDD